jgi:hypothetical protein
VHLERVDRHLHRHDCALRTDHQLDVVWLPVRLHLVDFHLHGHARNLLVLHQFDDVWRGPQLLLVQHFDAVHRDAHAVRVDH